MNCKCQLLARRPAHLSNSPTKDYVEHVRSYENESDVAPAGARQLVSSVRPTPNDAQLPTKPAGPKSELPTANRPVATSLFAVQFQQNHSLRTALLMGFGLDRCPESVSGEGPTNLFKKKEKDVTVMEMKLGPINSRRRWLPVASEIAEHLRLLRMTAPNDARPSPLLSKHCPLPSHWQIRSYLTALGPSHLWRRHCSDTLLQTGK